MTPDPQPHSRPGRGATLLDVAAFVIGAAVSALHLRSQAESDLSRGLGWFFWLTFAGVATTAAGPFFFPGRRLLRPIPNYPTPNDRCWIALGIPWSLTGPLCLGDHAASSLRSTIYPFALSVALAIACVYVLGTQWTQWRKHPSLDDGNADWTARVGGALAVSWPLQCAFALVLLS